MKQEKTIDQIADEVRAEYQKIIGKSARSVVNKRMAEIMREKYGKNVVRQNRDLWVSARRAGVNSPMSVEFATCYALAILEYKKSIKDAAELVALVQNA
jgi:hypothetical protein